MYPKGWKDWHPPREGSREREPGTALALASPSSSSHIFTNNLKKGVGDMFIPFAHDPDPRSTVTSFHSRMEMEAKPHRSQPRARVKILHSGLKRPTAFIMGPGACLIVVCLLNEVSPRCVGPGTQHGVLL